MTNRNYCFLKSNSVVALGGIPRLSNLASAVSAMKVPPAASIDTYWWSLPPSLHGPPSLPHPRILLPEHLWCSSPCLFSKKKTSSVYPQYRFGLDQPKQIRTSVRFALPKRSPKSKPRPSPNNFGLSSHRLTHKFCL